MLTLMQKSNTISPPSQPPRPPQRAGGPALLATAAALLALAPALAGPSSSSLAPRAAASLAALPLAFEPLPEQPDAPAQFLARGRSYQFTIGPTQAQLTLCKVGPASPAPRDRVPSVFARTSQAQTLRLELVGANPQARAAGLGTLPGKINYLVGNDPARWRTLAIVDVSGGDVENTLWIGNVEAAN